MPKLIIHCPPMPVRNSSWWGNPFAARITDELVCAGNMDGIPFVITFPPCKVTWQGWGKWLVEAVVAQGGFPTGEVIRVSYPAEPVTRYWQNMVAHAIPSLSDSYLMMKDGTRRFIKADMPESIGRPVWLGLWTFIVDAVDIEGRVE